MRNFSTAAGGKVFGILIAILVLLPGGMGTAAFSSMEQAVSPLMKDTAQTSQLAAVAGEPVLTPAYAGPCGSSWYRYEDAPGHFTYVTLNAKTANNSTNSGTWKLAVPDDGIYQVEAYIPVSGDITWVGCTSTRTIAANTGSAAYTVNHAGGSATIRANQDAVKGGWLSLGEFAFTTQSGATITLIDQTGDAEEFTRGVVFSNLRLIWQQPLQVGEHRLSLPLVTDQFAPVQLQSIAALDSTGNSQGSFPIKEEVTLRAKGINLTGRAVEAQVNWLHESACDGSTTISNVTTNLAAGEWTLLQQVRLPDCAGIYTYTVQVTFQSQVSRLSENLSLKNPPGTVASQSRVVVSALPGFDKCEIPTLADLATWWNDSPYYSINLYIGGIARSCSNKDLNETWIRSASAQGWTFIPTWVGPQAPCSTFLYRFSSSTETAYSQGRAEAEAALQALDRIGFRQGKIVYYDLEAYPVETKCNAAVSSFMTGWMDRLHAAGARGGVYASPRWSNMTEWASLNPAPDDVWVAFWRTNPVYDPTVTVWGIPYLSDTLWANHQRIRQYAGGHSETWGGVKFSIDSNSLDGHVVGFSATEGAATADLPASMYPAGSGPEVETIQALSGEQSWALVDGNLLWTENGGQIWADRSPVAGAGDELAVFFLDSQRGWLASQDATSAQLSLVTTQDGGNHWRTVTLPAAGIDLALSDASVQFIDEQTGWVSIELQTGINFSLGTLFATYDGGRTWERRALPAGGKLWFQDAQQGWLAGGTGGDELYVTNDGGRTWQRAASILKDGLPAAFQAQAGQSLPSGTMEVDYPDPLIGWAIAQRGNCSGVKPSPGTPPVEEDPFQCVTGSVLLRTVDGGRTWADVTPSIDPEALHDPGR